MYYIAIYKIIGNTEYFLMMSNDETNMFRPYGVIEPGSQDEKLVKSGTPFASIDNDADGIWAISNIPLYNSGGRLVGIYEIGFDMTAYEISNMVLRNRISITVALMCLFIIIVLIIIISMIIRQLVSVGKVLGSVAKGDYSARISYKARDELGRVSSGFNYMAEELQSQFEKINSLNKSSIRFVPFQFMEHLKVNDITKLELGAHVQQNVCILFFDIQHFSISSETMSARENFLFVNKVLGIAGPILRKHSGFVDKYMGDSAMVIFADARDAVRAGIDLYKAILLDPENGVKIGIDGINIGIGIHSGSVMMGIVGENERLSSTVISDTVNLASRLESLTRQTKSGMLISRDVLNQISDSGEEFNYRFLGMVQVAGVNEVLGVYDVLDALSGDLKQRRLETRDFFESGIRKFHMKDYAEALLRFQHVLEDDPGDLCAVKCLEETHYRLVDPSLPSVITFGRK
jgi:class 3 adenylate cyclase/HAMP domain-containing protein